MQVNTHFQAHLHTHISGYSKHQNHLPTLLALSLDPSPYHLCLGCPLPIGFSSVRFPSKCTHTPLSLPVRADGEKTKNRAGDKHTYSVSQVRSKCLGLYVTSWPMSKRGRFQGRLGMAVRSWLNLQWLSAEVLSFNSGNRQLYGPKIAKGLISKALIWIGGCVLFSPPNRKN